MLLQPNLKLKCSVLYCELKNGIYITTGMVFNQKDML